METGNRLHLELERQNFVKVLIVNKGVRSSPVTQVFYLAAVFLTFFCNWTKKMKCFYFFFDHVFAV